jgi:agmatine deiminase
MLYYPPEWQVHKSTWFAFPHNLNEWNSSRLNSIQDWFIKLYDTVLNYEDIDLIFSSEELLTSSEAKLEHLHNKNFKLRKHIIPNNDIWIRDYGPFFIKNNSVTEVLDYEFNAWGGKFPPWDLDNQVPQKLAELFEYQYRSQPLIMEGGSLEFNGNGIIMTSEQCLLNKNRNPQFSKEEIEKNLKTNFNVDKIVWLKQGLEGDHTDGHIDDFARFVAEDTVLICSAEHDDINHNRLEQNKKILLEHGLRTIDLPLPEEMFIENERLPNSYANFIFVNSAIIVPVFSCKQDDIALRIFADIFPDREVIGMESRLLIEEGGGIHCASKQESL